MDAAYETLLTQLKTDLVPVLKQAVVDALPLVAAAAKSAVSDANPLAGLLAAPVIDEIDSYIAHLMNPGVPAPVVTAPVDVSSQIASLQKHVAALTVASGNATGQALATAKAVASVAPAPVIQKPA